MWSDQRGRRREGITRRCKSWPNWQGRGDSCAAAGGGLAEQAGTAGPDSAFPTAAKMWQYKSDAGRTPKVASASAQLVLLSLDGCHRRASPGVSAALSSAASGRSPKSCSSEPRTVTRNELSSSGMSSSLSCSCMEKVERIPGCFFFFFFPFCVHPGTLIPVVVASWLPASKRRLTTLILLNLERV